MQLLSVTFLTFMKKLMVGVFSGLISPALTVLYLNSKLLLHFSCFFSIPAFQDSLLGSAHSVIFPLPSQLVRFFEVLMNEKGL